MMYLHESREDFSDVISQIRNEKKIASSIVEKDYYVTMLLRELSLSGIDFVFKGGTSLSKCYQAIHRFSEDIDLTVLQKPTQSERRKIKETMLATAKRLQMNIANPEDIHSRRDFNRYQFTYRSIAEDTNVNNRIITEVFVATTPFPVENHSIGSYVQQTLKRHGLLEAIRKYHLEDTSILVQSIERTLIDKIFALCDYYLQSIPERNSRHIYDIHQILAHRSLDDIPHELVTHVRRIRQANPKCLSARGNIIIPKLLHKIIQERFFERDYNDLTLNLLFQPVPYEDAIQGLSIVAEWDALR